MRNIFQIFFSKNSKMEKIGRILDKIGGSDIPVLIRGEEGVGKGLVAEAIHLNSNRRSKPFIRVNCSAVPKELLETELFGCERGILGEGHLKMRGMFELANGGTILLSGIGGMDFSLQAKLLRVLREGEFYRLGAEEDVRVNARVLSSAENQLERRVRERRFREDLFFHMNAISIAVPPLRDRREQIVPLAKYFFELHWREPDRRIPPLSLRTIAAFKAYDWPGNVRELENTVREIVLSGEEEACLLEMRERRPDPGWRRKPLESGPSFATNDQDALCLKDIGKKAAERAESEMIREILQETHWNRRETARALRISYKALLHRIQKYGLNESEHFIA